MTVKREYHLGKRCFVPCEVMVCNCSGNQYFRDDLERGIIKLCKNCRCGSIEQKNSDGMRFWSSCKECQGWGYIYPGEKHDRERNGI